MSRQEIHMKKIDIVKVTEYISPNPMTVICTTKPDGTPNLTLVYWFTYLLFNPPTVVFAMEHGFCTGKVLHGSGEAIVTVPATRIW